MKTIRYKDFANGSVFCLELEDGKLIEVTDTFLPFYTKDAIGRKQNNLIDDNLGNRKERWLVGVSVMSGCPVRCKFCATGTMKHWRNLTSEEIVEQVDFIVNRNGLDPTKSKEFKINMTRMGEPFLNIENVKKSINILTNKYPNVHIYVSTIGIEGSDLSFIKDNITLQLSLHSLDEEHRNWLIPFKNKMSIESLGKVRTDSKLKTTLNLTLVDDSDFDIEKIKKYFDKTKFFIKLSPINVNEISEKNELGEGIIKSINIQ
jgi:adenine C2-methylase RlmN of 23S rRNA A2503 and tRNA A37